MYLMKALNNLIVDLPDQFYMHNSNKIILTI